MASVNEASGVSASAERSDPRQGLRVCMVAYSFYESDTRILQYTAALAERGDMVDVLALRRDDAQAEKEVLDGVNVYRIQSRTVNEKGLFAYANRILRFLFRAALVLRRMHREHPYDVIHVHNVPDFLVFAAAFPKRRGASVILDIHDLLPEFYASKFKVSHESFLFKVMAYIERRSATFATHVIIANHLWRDRAGCSISTSREVQCDSQLSGSRYFRGPIYA